MDTEDIAEFLGVSTNQVRWLARQGRIPYVRRGNRICVPVEAWDEFMESQKSLALAAVKANKGISYVSVG